MRHLCWPLMFVLPSLLGADSPATIEFVVKDSATKEAMPCRIHLLESAGKPVKPEGITLPFWRDHFVCEGAAKVQVPAGEYRYEIERGPEYAAARQQIVVKAGETLPIAESLKRITDLKREGWWSGETHVHRPLDDVELLMRAEDLHVAVVETWWNDRNLWTDRDLPERVVTVFDKTRMYDVLGGEDERGGGALLFSGLKSPLPIAGSKRESPPSSKWLAEGKKLGAWVDAEKPFWWDVERIEKLPAKIVLKESGWFIVRAIADVPQTFRFASTAPWYVVCRDRRSEAEAQSRVVRVLPAMDRRADRLPAPKIDHRRSTPGGLAGSRSRAPLLVRPRVAVNGVKQQVQLAHLDCFKFSKLRGTSHLRRVTSTIQPSDTHVNLATSSYVIDQR